MTETKVRLADLIASLEANKTRARELRADSIAIQQRLTVSRQELAEVMACTQALLDAVHEQRTSQQAKQVAQTTSEPVSALLKALAMVGRNESDLEEMTDDLIVAYQAAVVTGDDDMQLLLAGALKQIGRHFAMKIGPKAAGVIMN